MAELVDARDSKSRAREGVSVRFRPRAPSFPTFTDNVPDSIRFCIRCGQPVTRQVPRGDYLPRHVCAACGHIHYLNPKLVVGCVPEWQGRVLICKRAIEPRLGFWTVPAGFMENGETTEQAAKRETLEEAEARVEILAPLALVNVPHISQVHLMFRARLLDGKYGVGQESLETRLVDEAEIPWEGLAFPSVRFTLERYFADCANGLTGFHTTAIVGQPF